MKLVGMKDDLVNGKEGALRHIWDLGREFLQRRNSFLRKIRKTLRID